MTLKTLAEEKWWKIGAATVLSVGLLAGCGDGKDDTIVDDNMNSDVDQHLDDDNKD
ncbi:hypothetical protein [Psychrobacillus sp. L4]|uniref:hypothetical protein n=1 Tax=Psychrobacillus sp. L4 TaxID=3236892 RepID=UPI0036F3B2B2